MRQSPILIALQMVKSANLSYVTFERLHYVIHQRMLKRIVVGQYILLETRFGIGILFSGSTDLKIQPTKVNGPLTSYIRNIEYINLLDVCFALKYQTCVTYRRLSLIIQTRLIRTLFPSPSNILPNSEFRIRQTDFDGPMVFVLTRVYSIVIESLI